MTPDVETIHRPEDGEYVTIHRVTIEDAVGREFDHDFLWNDVDGYHEYRGHGDPPESAVDALEEWSESWGSA